MNKPKITQEQADEIVDAKQKYENILILEMYEIAGKMHYCDNLDRDTFIRAVYIGYEVEETPEDKVREYYKDQIKRASSRDGTDHVSPAAIRKVLDLLNIKIDGVNHD